MAQQTAPYPATLSVDYPDRQLDKMTSFFRIFTSIPIWIVLATILMLVFRQKYPRWWFDWNLALTRFGTRVVAYLALMRDEYPSTDEEQAVHIELSYPDVKKDLKRGMPLVKWFLAIPHWFLLAFLLAAAII